METRLWKAVVGGVLVLAALASVLTLMPKKALAEESDLIRTISVSGESAIAVVPDMATVTFGVETNASSARGAQDENTRIMRAIVESLAKFNIDDVDIQTSNFSLYPVYGRESDKSDAKIVVTGYRSSNQVTVKVRALDTVGQIIDKVVEAGATNVGGLSFGIQDPEPHRELALAEAVKNARAKADVMAEAAGVVVSDIKAMSDSYVNVASWDLRDEMVMKTASGVPIQEGSVMVRAQVRVDFIF